jgi:hypothetical protein
MLCLQKSETGTDAGLPAVPPMDEYFNDGFHCDINVRILSSYAVPVILWMWDMTSWLDGDNVIVHWSEISFKYWGFIDFHGSDDNKILQILLIYWPPHPHPFSFHLW